MPATWASAIAFSPDRPAKRPVGALRGLHAARHSNRTHSGVLVAIRERKSGPPPAERATTPSSSSRRMGWRRLARPKGSQLFNLPYSYKPFSRKFGPSPVPLRTGLLLENRDLRSRAPPPPPAEGATSLLLRRLRGLLRKRTSPDGHCPRALAIHSILPSAK